jgi:glycosyltransferase involved in cell wall biosynthesis
VNTATTQHDDSDHPRVSVIVPFLNEERHIERCVASIQSQSGLRNSVEIIAVDGGSTDRSRAILARMGESDPCIRVIDNPQRTAAAGLNVGLAHAHGEFILRVDAHSIIAPDYVERCITYLATHPEVANVGGILHPVGETAAGEAIAAALKSPFSMGWSPSRYCRRPEETDTVYLGAFRRREIDAIGQYDATLVANEDYELNIRLRAAGKRIWCDPTIASQTFTRAGMAALARQYARYGFWKARVLRLHPASALPRHLVAPSFVASLLLFLIAGIGYHVWEPLGALCGAYALANLYFAWRVRHAAGRRARLLVPLAFAIMHVCWGAGFWAGWLPVRNARQSDRL